MSRVWVTFDVVMVAATSSCGLSDSGGDSAPGGAATTGGNGVSGQSSAGEQGSTGGRSTSGGQSSAGGRSTGGRGTTGGQGSGGDESGGDPGTATPPGGAAGASGVSKTYPLTLDGLFSAQCDAAQACCVKNGPGSVAQNCAARFRQGELATLFARENVGLDLQALERCILAYENAQTTCTDTGIAQACRGLAVGDVAEHEPCSVFEQCSRHAGPVFCRYAGDETQGRCVPIVHGEEGQECDDDCVSGVECSGTQSLLTDPLEPEVQCFESEGLYCSREESPPVCRRIHALGEECESGRSCGASQARCRTICEPRSQIDEPCQTNQRDDCELDLQCLGTSETGWCVEYEFFRAPVCD